MEVRAVTKYVHTGPRKVRKFGDLVRGADVEYARGVLSVQASPAAKVLLKTLNSAIANAENNHGLDAEDLRIGKLMIDDGMKMPRLRPRARGRADRYYKRTCHVTVVVTDDGEE